MVPILPRNAWLKDWKGLDRDCPVVGVGGWVSVEGLDQLKDLELSQGLELLNDLELLKDLAQNEGVLPVEKVPRRLQADRQRKHLIVILLKCVC
jgi:hypothetical protein